MIVNNLPQYVEEHRLPILRNAVIGNRSAKEFNLQTGVKGATALNLLVTDVTFGDGSACGWNEAGTSTLSQRILTPGAIKVNMSFCDKTLLKTWANYDVRVAAGQKTLPFEEDFINGVVDSVKAKLEKAMWMGDASTRNTNPDTNKFDGIVKIMSNETAAGTYTIQANDTVTAIVNGVYALIPSAAYEKGEVVMYMGYDNYRKWIQELIANGNLVLNAGNGAVLDGVAMPTSMLIPGTNVRVIPVAGLDGSANYKVFASYRDNFVFGTDMTGDEEKAEMWYSKDNREFRLAIEFTAGVQVAFPNMVAVGYKA